MNKLTSNNKILVSDIVVVILILLNDSFFYLISDTITTPLAAVFSIILFLYSIINHYKRPKTISLLIYSLLAIQVISVAYSTFKYGQDYLSGLFNTYRFFIYLSFFYLYNHYSSREKLVHLLELVSKLSVIVCLVILLQYVLFPSVIFFHKFAVRNGQIRLYMVTGIRCLPVVVYNLFLFLEKKSKKGIFRFIIILLGTYLGNGTRGSLMMYIVVSALTIFIFYYTFSNRNNKLVWLISLPILIVLVGGLFYYVNYQGIQSIQTEVQSNSGSAATRMNELIYYYDLLKKSPLLGIGTLSGNYADVIYGTLQHWYYIEDTGDLIIVFKYGLLGLVWLLSFLMYVMTRVKKSKHEEDRMMFFFSVYYICWIIIGISYSATLTSINSIFYTCISFVILEYNSIEKNKLLWRKK